MTLDDRVKIFLLIGAIFPTAANAVSYVAVKQALKDGGSRARYEKLVEYEARKNKGLKLVYDLMIPGRELAYYFHEEEQ